MEEPMEDSIRQSVENDLMEETPMHRESMALICTRRDDYSLTKSCGSFSDDSIPVTPAELSVEPTSEDEDEKEDDDEADDEETEGEDEEDDSDSDSGEGSAAEQQGSSQGLDATELRRAMNSMGYHGRPEHFEEIVRRRDANRGNLFF